MRLRTKQNLFAAMQCDALDAAKFARFAMRARIDDDWELAKVFQETADTERTVHFSKKAELGGLIASSPENLRNAIDDEIKEVERFAEFAREAAEDRDFGIASVFEQISRDKAERRARFEAGLADMDLHSNPQTVTDKKRHDENTSACDQINSTCASCHHVETESPQVSSD